MTEKEGGDFSVQCGEITVESKQCEGSTFTVEIILRIVKELKNRENIKAENSKEAVEQFEKSGPGEIDMILMDVQMPVMNGYEATRAIRDSAHPSAKTIPIVAMTANAFSDDVRDALKAGMNGHIAKRLI